jgi:hypothetical protein
MNIQFQGRHRLFGNPETIHTQLETLKKNHPLVISAQLGGGRALAVSGEDTVDFFRNRLNIALSPRETRFLSPTVFKDPNEQPQYQKVMTELQQLAEDAEDQQDALDYNPSHGLLWRPLAELLEAFIQR